MTRHVVSITPLAVIDGPAQALPATCHGPRGRSQWTRSARRRLQSNRPGAIHQLLCDCLSGPALYGAATAPPATWTGGPPIDHPAITMGWSAIARPTGDLWCVIHYPRRTLGSPLRIGDHLVGMNPIDDHEVIKRLRSIVIIRDQAIHHEPPLPSPATATKVRPYECFSCHRPGLPSI